MKSILFYFVPILLILSWVALTSATIKVMPTGDSLTAQSAPGYRGYLFQMLKDSGYTVDFVGGHNSVPTEPLNTDGDNSGFGGYVIGPDSSYLDTWNGGKGTASINWELENHEKIMSKGAEVMILMIGVNDFGNNRNVFYNPGVQGAIRLDSLVEKIYRLSPNIKIILSNLTPVKYDLAGGNYAKFNRDVPLIAQKQTIKGRGCFFVNNCKGDFVGTDYAPNDQVHFNATGYQKLARNFYQVLAPVLKSMGAKTGINDVKASKIILYPNPATDKITLKEIEGDVSILNLLGESVQSIKSYKGEAICLNNFSNGIYLVKTSKGAIPFIKQ